jgi:hypothetical protein
MGMTSWISGTLACEKRFVRSRNICEVSLRKNYDGNNKATNLENCNKLFGELPLSWGESECLQVGACREHDDSIFKRHMSLQTNEIGVPSRRNPAIQVFFLTTKMWGSIDNLFEPFLKRRCVVEATC